mmetsp:Transcript_6081/g.14917  ORF Transcript_6081/g.14917 Transcript_6081/m.14917 type:complete len:724 (-) Transcript_6081:103-2274(-)
MGIRFCEGTRESRRTLLAPLSEGRGVVSWVPDLGLKKIHDLREFEGWVSCFMSDLLPDLTHSSFDVVLPSVHTSLSSDLQATSGKTGASKILPVMKGERVLMIVNPFPTPPLPGDPSSVGVLIVPLKGETHEGSAFALELDKSRATNWKDVFDFPEWRGRSPPNGILFAFLAVVDEFECETDGSALRSSFAGSHTTKRVHAQVLSIHDPFSRQAFPLYWNEWGRCHIPPIDVPPSIATVRSPSNLLSPRSPRTPHFSLCRNSPMSPRPASHPLFSMDESFWLRILSTTGQLCDRNTKASARFSLGMGRILSLDSTPCSDAAQEKEICMTTPDPGHQGKLLGPSLGDLSIRHTWSLSLSEKLTVASSPLKTGERQNIKETFSSWNVRRGAGIPVLIHRPVGGMQFRVCDVQSAVFCERKAVSAPGTERVLQRKRGDDSHQSPTEWTFLGWKPFLSCVERMCTDPRVCVHLSPQCLDDAYGHWNLDAVGVPHGPPNLRHPVSCTKSTQEKKDQDMETEQRDDFFSFFSSSSFSSFRFSLSPAHNTPTPLIGNVFCGWLQVSEKTDPAEQPSVTSTQVYQGKRSNGSTTQIQHQEYRERENCPTKGVVTPDSMTHIYINRMSQQSIPVITPRDMLFELQCVRLRTDVLGSSPRLRASDSALSIHDLHKQYPVFLASEQKTSDAFFFSIFCFVFFSESVPRIHPPQPKRIEQVERGWCTVPRSPSDT